MKEMLSEVLIQQDVAPFSDPGTTSKIECANNKIRIKMVRFGDDRDYIFDVISGRVEARHSGERFVNISSLLASNEFADLRAFANTQRQVLLKKNLESLIAPSGKIDPEGENRDLSLDEGRHLLLPSFQAGVKVILLDGPAGVGKTSFIERMVFERASNPSLPPIFHITSKGRRLSNLPDAMGKTASDLNARFRAEHIQILARHNVLQVAIDGFDELVQPDGYGNAWEALKDFVRQMGSNGPLILAGRDTFFDQQGVKSHFDKIRVDLLTIRLTEVTESRAKEWLLGRGWDATQFSDPDVIEFFKRDYTRRPFFLTQIAEFENFSGIPADLGSPQAILVDRLLEREANILKPVLQSLDSNTIKAALSGVFEELAVDMADRETESASLSFIEFLCEVVFTNIATEDERNALTKKIGSAPLLEKGGNDAECKFPHLEIQNHFLAKALVGALVKKESFPSLRGAVYGADSIEAFADVFRTLPDEDAEVVSIELERLLREERHTFRLTANVSSLLIGSLVRKRIGDVVVFVSDVVTGDVRVFDELSTANFKNVTIPHFDVRSADLSSVVFENSSVSLLIVDDSTHFGNTCPSVSAMQLHANGSIHVERDTAAVNKWLREHSSCTDVPESVVWEKLPLTRLFDRLCRRFIRQHYIRENERDDSRILLTDNLWPVLREMLIDMNAIICTRRTNTSGSPDNFYYMHSPEKLLAPSGDGESIKIRNAVLKKAKELEILRN